DQTIRYMNKGLTPDELVEVVSLPDHLANHPWLGEFYGTVHHSVRQIYVDGIGMALTLSRQSVATFLDYHPQVMHDLHESAPFLYIMSGHGPFNPWLDPITTEEWTEMAWLEVRQMNAWNVPGVWTFDFWDGWASNYMIYAALGHNAIGRFYETFGNSTPDTREREVGRQSNRAWFRMNPPMKKVLWSLRNNTNLMQSALLVGMNNVATHKERFLENFYLKSRRAVDKAHTEGPAAWLIPADQPRPILATRLVNLLRLHGIEVHGTDQSFTAEAEAGPGRPAEEKEFAAGSFLVRMDQPYGRLADMLLDYQYYNPHDPSPYDDTGWSLGPLFNVDTYRVADLAALDVAMEKLGADVRPAGGVRGNGDAAYLVNATGEPDLAVLRYRLADVPVRAAEEAFEEGDRSFAAGTFIIAADSAAGLRSRLDALGRELGVEIVAAASEPDVASHQVSTPRIALMHNWSRTQSEGWYRFALDDLGIPYDYISIHDVRNVADLRSRWDVILVGPGIGNLSGLVNGSAAPGPIPYQSSELTPNLGRIDSTDDTRPGMGYEGLMNLQRFVERGGLLATMTTSSRFAVDAGLTPFVAVDNTPSDLQARGAVFNAKVTDPASPIVYGYQQDLAVYFSNAPLLRVAVGGGGFRRFFGGGGAEQKPSGRRGEDLVPGRPPAPKEEEAAKDQPWTNVDDLLRQTDPRIIASRPPARTFPRIIMRFAERPEELLVSGMINNGRSLAARPAIIDAPVGDGHVVMFAINPIWRQQTLGQFGLLFNAILHFDSLDIGRQDEAALTEGTDTDTR
ncbi:MAG: alkyl sulfatase dimerization domain-containing protein, partial [Acidobacteriota bacterium]